MNYYNENDPFLCEWLQQLMWEGHIPQGFIDNRSIEDVSPSDLVGYTQCHFFAGIGGWAYALKLAGWPSNRHVWTASCPCQPFSTAGKGKGINDERHLWPSLFHLISIRKPDTLFGEQVAKKHGLTWFDGVSCDMEAINYTIGAAVTSAAGSGAPHVRQRLYFVADSERKGFQVRQFQEDRRRDLQQWWQERQAFAANNSQTPWSDAVWQQGEDGLWRSTQPGICLLADGIQNRVGQIRGFGNAIVPEQAKLFVESFLEVEYERVIS